MLGIYLKQIRAYQWIKNFLCFVPIIAAHQLSETSKLYNTFLIFFAFCLCASSVYMFNDFIDLEHDRLHPNKCKRPLALDQLKLNQIFILAIIFLGLSFYISIRVETKTTYALVLYIFINLTYSLWLKKKAILDVFILSSLYGLRLLAGAYAGDIEISPWLIGFSMFFFLSLAILKRYLELSLTNQSLKGRSYGVNDMHLLLVMGVSSAFVCALVLALYVSSDHIMQLYRRPKLLLLICPLLLYWQLRTWFKHQKNAVHDDPVLIFLKDPVSYVVFLICTLIFLIAS